MIYNNIDINKYTAISEEIPFVVNAYGPNTNLTFNNYKGSYPSNHNVFCSIIDTNFDVLTSGYNIHNFTESSVKIFYNILSNINNTIIDVGDIILLSKRSGNVYTYSSYHTVLEKYTENGQYCIIVDNLTKYNFDFNSTSSYKINKGTIISLNEIKKEYLIGNNILHKLPYTFENNIKTILREKIRDVLKDEDDIYFGQQYNYRLYLTENYNFNFPIKSLLNFPSLNRTEIWYYNDITVSGEINVKTNDRLTISVPYHTLNINSFEGISSTQMRIRVLNKENYWNANIANVYYMPGNYYVNASMYVGKTITISNLTSNNWSILEGKYNVVSVTPINPGPNSGWDIIVDSNQGIFSTINLTGKSICFEIGNKQINQNINSFNIGYFGTSKMELAEGEYMCFYENGGLQTYSPYQIEAFNNRTQLYLSPLFLPTVQNDYIYTSFDSYFNQKDYMRYSNNSYWTPNFFKDIFLINGDNQLKYMATVANNDVTLHSDDYNKIKYDSKFYIKYYFGQNTSLNSQLTARFRFFKNEQDFVANTPKGNIDIELGGSFTPSFNNVYIPQGINQLIKMIQAGSTRYSITEYGISLVQDFDDISIYTFELFDYNGTKKLTYPISYKVLKECINTVDLLWKDSFGSFISHPFFIKSKTNVVNKEVYMNYNNSYSLNENGLSYDTENNVNNNQTYYTRNSRSYDLSTIHFVTPQDQLLLEDLINSVEIYLRVPDDTQSLLYLIDILYDGTDDIVTVDGDEILINNVPIIILGFEKGSMLPVIMNTESLSDGRNIYNQNVSYTLSVSLANQEFRKNANINVYDRINLG